MWGQPLESRRKQLKQQPFKSYFQFRFDGHHLKSVVNNVGRHRFRHIEVGRGRKCGAIRCKYVSMLLETEVTAEKCPIFPWRVPMVFEVAPVILIRAILAPKTSEHLELDHRGTGLGHFS